MKAKNVFTWKLREVLTSLPRDVMPPAHKSILRAIAEFANADGAGAFPSLDMLSKLTGFAPATISTNIQDLVNHDWIQRFYRSRDDGGSTSCGYVVRLNGTPIYREKKPKKGAGKLQKNREKARAAQKDAIVRGAQRAGIRFAQPTDKELWLLHQWLRGWVTNSEIKGVKQQRQMPAASRLNWLETLAQGGARQGCKTVEELVRWGTGKSAAELRAAANPPPG